MARRTARQLARRRQVERGLRLAAPALDLVLFVTDRVSRIAGRQLEDPEPPRRLPRGRPPLE